MSLVGQANRSIFSFGRWLTQTQQQNYTQAQQPYTQPQQPYTPGRQSYGYSNFNAEDYYARNNAFDSDALGKSRGIFALLAILIGGLGVQYFYIGKTTAGLLTILLSVSSPSRAPWCSRCSISMPRFSRK